MRKSKFTESQIVAILKGRRSGMAVAEFCRKHGIGATTWYSWKNKYAGATVSDLTRMRELETENTRLKRMYAELALDNATMKDVIAKSTDAVGQTAAGSGLDSRERRLPIRRACLISGLSRAAFCRAGESPVERDGEIIDALNAIVEGSPEMGVLEMLQPTAARWSHLKSQARLARVLPARAQHPQAYKEAASGPRARAVDCGQIGQ